MGQQRNDDDVATMLATLGPEEFRATVLRAECDADRAIAVRDEMRLWAERLRPYLAGGAATTLADALDRFRHEREAGGA